MGVLNAPAYAPWSRRPMKNARAIFRFLLEAAARGERTVLVTITDIVGGSSRSPGTHMAVSESGDWLGALSGGCVEAAIAGEARRVLETDEAKVLRFGAGSPFIDVRLPCGGTIDLLMVPQPASELLREALARLDARQPVALRLARSGAMAVEVSAGAAPSAWDGPWFVARHAPDLRLCVLGHGAEVMALARLGQAYGADVVVLTPEEAIAGEAAARGMASHLLMTASRSPHLQADAGTAVVFLFHDHDWEIELLRQALEQDAFFVGAMGSRGTHAARAAALAAVGVSAADIERVVGPIGLIPATRDPEGLAVSVLAQIVGRRPPG